MSAEPDSNSINARNKKESKLCFSGIVMQLFKECLESRGKEMRGGQTVSSIVLLPVPEKRDTYIEDTREVYCNKVIALHNCIRSRMEKYTDEKKTRKDTKEKFETDVDKAIKSIETYDSGSKEDVEQFKNGRVALFDEFFKSINDFLNELDYFSDEEAEE